ncbi:MAG: Maf family protein [Terriglobales bacterium]
MAGLAGAARAGGGGQQRHFMIVLASASPRRLELLTAAGWQVEVRPADVDETLRPHEPASDYVLRLARAKARAVAPARVPIVGADTVVVVAGEVLGKPADDGAAAAMLARLAGHEHQVLTGFCVLSPHGRERNGVEATSVWFAPLSAQQIASYVATGEPRGKAGAYAIQGRAACFIPRIEGSYSNVVGLPLAAVWGALRALSEAD